MKLITFFAYVVALFLGKARDISNKAIALWVRKNIGPSVPSAKHAINKNDIPTIGFCPECGGAIFQNQAVWLIASIPTDNEILGEMCQRHCIFYTFENLFRVAACMNCREKPHRSDIIAVLNKNGKPEHISSMPGEHKISKNSLNLFEDLIPYNLPSIISSSKAKT